MIAHTDYFKVASWNENIIVKVMGYATQNNSLFFRDFVENMLKKGYRKFTVDLSSCKGMDSTFMGVLIGMVENVQLINTNRYHRSLLDGLGISRLLSIVKEPVSLPDLKMVTLQETSYDPNRRLKMICDVHQHLAKLNAQNAQMFGEFLRPFDDEKKYKHNE